MRQMECIVRVFAFAYVDVVSCLDPVLERASVWCLLSSFLVHVNSPCYTIKTVPFAHALGSDDLAKPRNCSIVTRPFPS